MLSATRRRVLPASLLVTGALGVSVLTATIPAQASVAPTTVTTSVASGSVAAAAVTTSSVSPAAAVHTVVLTRAQVATAARAAAAARLAAKVFKIRVTAVSIARSRLGSRYVAGHAGPHAFDCSGLALYVVRKATGRSLPHYSKAQYAATKRVARSSLRPGDLVFFFRHGTHHVGIYIGHGRMISATNPRSGVRIDSVFSGWYGSRYSGAGRLV